MIDCPIPEAPVFTPTVLEHQEKSRHHSSRKGQGKQDMKSKEPTEKTGLPFGGDRVSEQKRRESPPEKSNNLMSVDCNMLLLSVVIRRPVEEGQISWATLGYVNVTVSE